jgi:hypothetical protein
MKSFGNYAGDTLVLRLTGALSYCRPNSFKPRSI